MRATASGVDVDISSIGGKLAFPMGGWHHASKFEAYSDALHNEVQQFDVHVVVIEPGRIATEFGGLATREGNNLSGQGHYASLAAAMDKLHLENALPGPAVISDVAVKMLRSKQPRARVRNRAGPMLFMKRWLSDCSFDRLVGMAFK